MDRERGRGLDRGKYRDMDRERDRGLDRGIDRGIDRWIRGDRQRDKGDRQIGFDIYITAGFKQLTNL